MPKSDLAELTSLPHADLDALAQDPYALFRAMRPDHPLVRLDEKQFMVLRAEDVIAMLTDPRTSQIEGSDYARFNRLPEGAVSRFLADFFLFANGRDHRAKRSMFARSFTLGRIRAEQGKIRAVAEAIAGDMPRGEPFDFVERMAARVPAEMIARLLGLPTSDAGYFSRRVYALARSLTPAYPHEDHGEIERATEELFDYVEGQLLDRLLAPGDDLLSQLVSDWRRDGTIPLDSLVHQVMGMIVGGVDTTRAGFAMTVALLLQHPEQWEALKREPSLVPGAVAEGLRYEPSVGSIGRVTAEPVTIGGIELPAGAFLRVSTMSAMRDPGLYADPERFDIRRTDHPRLHAVFGHGPHRCIGEMLARFEMEEALAALIANAPEIELVTPPRMLGFGGIRQITPMIVRIP